MLRSVGGSGTAADGARTPSSLDDGSVVRCAQTSFSRPAREAGNRAASADILFGAGCGSSTGTARGELAYLLCRSLRARRVIHFGASIGESVPPLAAAMRDNGGGSVICAGMAQQNIAASRRYLADAGLSEYVEIPEGGTLETLHRLGGDIDFAMIAGASDGGRPSLALQAIRVIAPRMQGGAIVLGDRVEADYLAWVRQPTHGFRSMNVRLEKDVELSVKVAADSI